MGLHFHCTGISVQKLKHSITLTLLAYSQIGCVKCAAKTSFERKIILHTKCLQQTNSKNRGAPASISHLSNKNLRCHTQRMRIRCTYLLSHL